MIQRLSLRSRAAILLVAVLLVVTGVFGALALSGQAVADASSSAARIQQYDDATLGFRTGLADQESGLRGFALSGDARFLEPYTGGEAMVAAELGSLKQMSLPQNAGLLSAAEKDASAWQAWAVARVASIKSAGPGPNPSDLEGKRLFDAFRADFARLDSHDNNLLLASGSELTHQLQLQREIRTVGWLLVLGALVGLGGLIFFAILRPLRAQAEAVGDLEGPSDREIPGLGRRDEVGRLASALTAFREALGERVRLAQAMNAVATESELDAVAALAVERISDLVDAEEGTLTLVTGGIRHIVHSRSGDFAPGTLVEASSPGTSALASARAVQIAAADLPVSPLKDSILANDYGPILVVPLISGGEAVGTLNALRKAGRSPFDDAEIRRAEFIAPFVATSVKAARLIRDLREANSVKSRFLANMSHELRTPLNAILGFAQVLSAEDFGPMNERQHRYADHIENSGHRLLDLINDILDLAKVEAGLMQVTPIPIEVAPVLLESRSQIDRQAAAKRITLEYQLTQGLWASADPRRLQQVVLNLLSNAVKFTPEGGRVIVASNAVASGDAQVTVTDTGIGIRPEEHERIFDEFAQADDEDARTQRGTGLGLSLSRKLTELMGGSLTVESELGKGSRFTIAMPGATAPESDASAGPKVLVVEDEAPNLEFMMLTLEQAGYRGIPAPDVATAVRSLQRDRPAAVILDIALPDGVGWSVIDAVQGMPEGSRPPVLVVTATDDTPGGYVNRVASVMTKPVNRERVLAELARALEARPPQQE